MYPIADLVKGHHHLRNTRFYIPYYGLFALEDGACRLALGPADWMAEFNKVRLPYNINMLTQASAEFALGHREMLDEQARRIR
jgi:hypothetical protein